MPKVLVSGEESHVRKVTDALRRRGATVTEVTELAQLPEACQQAGDGVFDCYVQLAAPVRMEGASAVQRVRHFYADGVLARFSALDAARAALANPASIVFVLGTLPTEVTTDDDRNARRALTGILGRAARSDAAPGELKVRILDADADAERIAALALGQTPPPREEPRLAEMSLEEWRIELMSVALAET
jgi:CheY-like chemotaxis protein